MAAPLAALGSWYHLLLGYAIVLGVEAPLLLFVATLRRRPCYEQALALLPAGGFALGLYLARGAHLALTEWQRCVTSQIVYCSPEYGASIGREPQADLQALVASVQHQAVALGALTFVLVMGALALGLYWLPIARLATRPVARNATAQPPADDELGSLEITIEPLERKK